MNPPIPIMSPWRGRLVVLAGLVLVALNARIMVAVVSPLTPLMIDMPLSHSDESIIGVAPPLIFSMIGAISPALGRRYGLEAMMIAALLISSAGQFGRSLASTPTEFIIWSIPALAGTGIGNVLFPPLIKKYFPDRVGAVTSIYSIGATVSTALPPMFIYSIAKSTGWRFSVGVWAVIGIVGVIPWLVILFSSDRAGQRLAAIKRRLDPRTVVERPPKLAQPLWKNGTAWAIMITFSANSLIGYAMLTWLPAMLRDAGQSDVQANFALTLFTIGSLPGALIIPLITARMKRVWILTPIFFCGYFFGFLGLTIWPSQHTWVWMALTRLGDCFFAYIITMINLRTRTTRGSIAMSGFAQSVGYLIAAIAPWGFGALYSSAGNWHVPMLALLAVPPIQAIAGFIVARAEPVDV